ncbi:DMT family transporter [Nocardia farcinica]|uniref:DMT family transporter n=1 Tax=Nocardia farcinica TaxID=37329 RepID=UPI000A38FDCF|nr:multidrug efflux SMR transporter [Nocardia farcinica]MBA4854340.1 multidrug efflux SMR transporter [Nocardia farcinica]MBC9814525.1 multidrug efflux SMR transporter [Nocardia farcinica]SUE28448.1 small multidrug resistance protein [Nocardia farcinica]
MTTAYLYLGAAIAFEVLGTSLMKATDGFTRLWPTLACLAAYGVAFLTLSRSLRYGLAVGTAYAIWAGLGTALIVAIGTLFLHQPLTPAKIFALALIVIGVVVLNLSGTH